MTKVQAMLLAVLAAAAALTAALTGAGPVWVVGAAVAAPAVAVALPRFLLGVVSGAASAPHPTETMSGLEFEDHVAHIARSAGVPVIMTALTGDWGVDLIVGHRPHRLAVQCKRQSRPVGAGAVQEVVAGAIMQDCTQTMVVTNHDFTPAARRLAERHGCALVAGTDLPQLKSMIAQLTRPVRPPSI